MLGVGEENPDLPTLPAGALVQINVAAAMDERGYSTQNEKVIEEHGYLWLVERITPEYLHDEYNLYICRSIATGGRGWWFPYEVNLMETNDG